MPFVNVGAKEFDSGARIPTKKRLRELLAQDPSQVVFDCTGILEQGQIFRGDDIPEGTRLSVVGPDPYTTRRWYSTVDLHNGKLRVQ